MGARGAGWGTRGVDWKEEANEEDMIGGTITIRPSIYPFEIRQWKILRNDVESDFSVFVVRCQMPGKPCIFRLGLSAPQVSSGPETQRFGIPPSVYKGPKTPLPNT
jgi:hypothetical protein